MSDGSAPLSLNEVQVSAVAVRANVARVIVGKNEVIDLLLVALLSDGHVLLEDVPGMGKTVMAKALALIAVLLVVGASLRQWRMRGDDEREEGRSYWADLLLAEERLGERWVARGAQSVWLTSFVSQSLLAETLILFPEHQTT
jgi:hypothetical protein